MEKQHGQQLIKSEEKHGGLQKLFFHLHTKWLQTC